MCGRYASTANPAVLAAELDALDETDPDEQLRPEEAGANYNVAPTAKVLTIVARHDRGDKASPVLRRIRRMRWGLLPRFTKAAEPGVPARGKPLINARADTLSSSAAFRHSAQYKRCLVPMDGWYEWLTGADKADKAAKVPYYMSAGDGSRLYAAGLWAAWHDKAAPAVAPIISCTIVTSDAATPELARIHDRMPLIVAQADWDVWLDPDAADTRRILNGVSPEVAAAIDIRPVGSAVNSVKNNSPELLAPVSSEPTTLW